MTGEEKDTLRIGQRCRVQKHAEFSLNTRNEKRMLNDILDAFPFHKAAVFVDPSVEEALTLLLQELNFGAQVLVNRMSERVNLVVSLRPQALPRPASPAVVIHFNGRKGLEQFPTPNVTKGASSYSEKIIRFLAAKRRAILTCG